MIRLLPRRSNDVTYFTNDGARELEGLTPDGPGWWLRGGGDASDASDVARALITSDRSRVFGYDLVIAAPRPVSILLALDPDHAPDVVNSHRASVHSAVSYLESRALVVRDRSEGVERYRSGRWSTIVSFTHGLNRHGEPHLHDHVLVGARVANTSNVLDSRGLYAHARAADAIYCSSLRFELGQRTPWSVWRSFEGVEHVVGLDEGWRALWGGHHRDRGQKLSWSRDQTVDSWTRDRERYVPLGAMEPPRIRDVLDEHRFAGALEGRREVARRHVLGAWADAARFGQVASDSYRAIDSLYPDLRGGAGVHESTVGVIEARMINSTRQLGPRPLDLDRLDLWCQRSREIVLSRDERSRNGRNR